MTDVIGLDLGGTKIAVARLKGNELSKSVIQPTDLSGQEELIEQLVAMIGDCRGDELDGVGLGVPSIVEFEAGRVVSSANIPLADVPLREVLGERLGVRCSSTTTPPWPRSPRPTTTSCGWRPATWS